MIPDRELGRRTCQLELAADATSVRHGRDRLLPANSSTRSSDFQTHDTDGPIDKIAGSRPPAPAGNRRHRKGHLEPLRPQSCADLEQAGTNAPSRLGRTGPSLRTLQRERYTKTPLQLRLVVIDMSSSTTSRVDKVHSRTDRLPILSSRVC